MAVMGKPSTRVRGLNSRHSSERVPMRMASMMLLSLMQLGYAEETAILGRSKVLLP